MLAVSTSDCILAVHFLNKHTFDLSATIAAIKITAGTNPTITINSVKSYTSLGRRRLSVLGGGNGTAVNTTVTYSVVGDAAAAQQFYQGLSSGKPTWLTAFYTNANDYAWAYAGPPAPPPAAIVSSPPSTALLSPPTVSATPPKPLPRFEIYNVPELSVRAHAQFVAATSKFKLTQVSHAPCAQSSAAPSSRVAPATLSEPTATQTVASQSASPKPTATLS